MLVKTSLVWQLSHSIYIKVLHLKWLCVFHPIAWLITLHWQKISFSHIYCTPSLYPFKDPISYPIFARAFFFRRWNFHRKCQFPFIDLTKFPTNNDNVMFPYISLFCPTFTLWPRKSSIFPIFVILVIYWPRFCPFVHFVIVQYCIYCPIYRPILYLCFLGGNHPRNIYQKYGYHCWQW